MVYICNPNFRAINSVGSECLLYTEEVGGSSPSSPTKKKPTFEWVLFLVGLSLNSSNFFRELLSLSL